MPKGSKSKEEDPQNPALTVKNVAPPKLTGGGGFGFEDKVVGHFLACMLVDTPPLESEVGTIMRIDFQTRPDGWLMDDVLLTLHFGGVTQQCALSVKSNLQFGEHTAPPDFVTAAWQQLLHVESDIFDETNHYMGLVTAPLPSELHSALHTTLGKARVEDPEVLTARYAVPGWAGELEKQLFESLECPQPLQDLPEIGNQFTGRLVRRLYFLERDFEDTPSSWEQRAIELCRAALVSGNTSEGVALWESLLHIASEYRPRAGHLTRRLFLEKLRHRHSLKELPNHQSDWDRLSESSTISMDQVSDLIGQQVRLYRAAELEQLNDALTSVPGVVLLGSSGVGKSAVVKQWAAVQRQIPGRTLLWFDSESFENRHFQEFESSLRLNHPLSQILGNASSARPTLVIDGIDQINRAALKNVATLLKMLELDHPGSDWRVIVTSQTQEWQRVAEGLLAASLPTGKWRLIECAQLKLADLEEVWKAFPNLARLQYERRLHCVLGNLKILDLVACKVALGAPLDTTSWVGESSVADWFWNGVIGDGAERIKRMRFVETLAEKQAGELRTTIPLDSLDSVDFDPVTELIQERICRETVDGHIGFEHDLYGDWARQRLLVAHETDLSIYLKERAQSPLWHRAIRLYGVYLLEQPEGLRLWLSVFDALTADTEGGVIQDLLLESPIFAANPDLLLVQLYPTLISTDGRLLRRLLGRFLHSATLPDVGLMDLIQLEEADRAQVAARYRIPYWPLWLPILRFLHEHRHEVVALASSESAPLVQLWLDKIPGTWPLRAETASLGLLLGELGLAASDDWHHPAHQGRRQLYAAALAGGGDLPDDVSDFALRACKRRDVPPPVDDSQDEAAPRSRILTADPRYDPNEPMPSPWPDGPLACVDSEFRKLVLEEHGLRSLIQVRPSVAREVALAVLIRERHKYEWWYADQTIGRDLNIFSDHFPFPILYFDGPFLALLRTDFGEGLELITRLVNFATERWVQRVEEEYAKSVGEMSDRVEDRSNPGPQDQPIESSSFLTRLVSLIRDRRIKRVEQQRASAPVDRTVRARRSGMLDRLLSDWRRPPGRLVISLDGSEHTFIGDDRVYGWVAGLKRPPLPVEAALIALEQFFYKQLEDEISITEQVAMVLEHARSVAFLRILCDVGRRLPDLFVGPLRPLLGSQEIYRWEIDARIEGRTHLMIGAFQRGDWFVRMAQHFHTLEHRNQDLRDLALNLLFNRPATRPFFEEACRSWQLQKEEESDPNIQAFLEQLIVRFNLENFAVEELPEGGLAVVNVRHREIQAQHTEEHQQFADMGLVLTFPDRCRRLIDGEIVLSLDEVEQFWQDAQHLYALRESESIEKFLIAQIHSGICGGIAVLIRCRQDWLDGHEDHRRWCQEWLLHTAQDPPRDGLSVPESVSDTTWDCFAAEAASALWTRNPDIPELRQLIAMLVFAYHHRAVQILFARCAKQREVLGDDFARLKRLLLERAFLEARIANLKFYNEHIKPLDTTFVEQCNLTFHQWIERRIADFIASQGSTELAPWSASDDAGYFQTIDQFILGWRREEYPLDVELVQAAYSWIPTPNLAKNDAERFEWLTFWHESLSHSLRRPSQWSKRRSDHDQRVPYATDYWVLDRIAETLPYLDASEADQLWRPILSLSDEAHYWVEHFTSAFHKRALQSDSVPKEYISVLRKMVDFATSARKQGDSSWAHRGDCWLSLLGLESSTRRVWAERHRPLVAQLTDLYVSWAQNELSYGRWAAAFASFLVSPAADPIIIRGLVLLNDAASAQGSRTLDDEHARDAIASLLFRIWEAHRNQITSHQGNRTAFQNLLRLLVDQQQPLALELQTRIGGL